MADFRLDFSGSRLTGDIVRDGSRFAEDGGLVSQPRLAVFQDQHRGEDLLLRGHGPAFHPRVGFAEFCDGTQPAPLCLEKTQPSQFGCVEFNGSGCGYNPCSTPVEGESKSWGAVKSLYR